MSQILYYLKEMLIVAIPAAIVFCCFWPYRRQALNAMGLRTNPWRETGLILFIMCLFGVLAVTLWPIYMREPNSGNTGRIILLVDRPGPMYNVNLIPFRMFGDYLRDIQSGRFLFTLINFFGNLAVFVPLFFGNLAVFVPLGFFPALLFHRATWRRSLLVGLATSVFVECGQYLVVRFVDIDDVILNTLGALCGFWVYLLLKRAAPKITARFKLQKTEDAHGRKTGDRTAPQRAE